MVNELLINLVNQVLGTGKRTARGNQAYVCPFHVSNPPGKKNLEINFTENSEGKNKWACWGCGKKGQTIYNLFKQLNVSQEILSQLKPIKSNTFYVDSPKSSTILTLPEEFKKFDSSVMSKHARFYLKKRNITDLEIIKYRMGYCEYGKYSKMIIIPSYDKDGILNYFTARSFEEKPSKKYLNPDSSRDIIPFELFINWDLPIILCEGPFDAFTIKRNAIPLFGKNISNSLMKKLISSQVKKIYIALDNDAIKTSLEFCELLLNEGKEVYLVELSKKDPSEIGFEEFTTLIQNTIPLTQYKLMEKKLEII